MAEAGARSPGRVRRVLVGATLVLVGIATLVGGAGWWALRSEPSWYRAAAVIAQSDERAARAQGLERGATAAISQSREAGEPWSVEIKEEDASAWLESRLPRWLANRGGAWPAGWTEPRVRFEGGRVMVGVRDPGGRIVGASALIEIEGNRLRLRGGSVWAGGLALPIAAARGLWTGVPADEARVWAGLLSGSRDAPAMIDLDDGRRVQLLAARAEGGRLRVTCRTLLSR